MSFISPRILFLFACVLMQGFAATSALAGPGDGAAAADQVTLASKITLRGSGLQDTGCYHEVMDLARVRYFLKHARPLSKRELQEMDAEPTHNNEHCIASLKVLLPDGAVVKVQINSQGRGQYGTGPLSTCRGCSWLMEPNFFKALRLPVTGPMTRFEEPIPIVKYGQGNHPCPELHLDQVKVDYLFKHASPVSPRDHVRQAPFQPAEACVAYANFSIGEKGFQLRLRHRSEYAMVVMVEDLYDRYYFFKCSTCTRLLDPNWRQP